MFLCLAIFGRQWRNLERTFRQGRGGGGSYELRIQIIAIVTWFLRDSSLFLIFWFVILLLRTTYRYIAFDLFFFVAIVRLHLFFFFKFKFSTFSVYVCCLCRCVWPVCHYLQRSGHQTHSPGVHRVRHVPALATAPHERYLSLLEKYVSPGV